MTTSQQQLDIEQLRTKWAELLPSLEEKGAPFYTLMKFNDDKNLGEIFAYPGVSFGFDVHVLTVTLFPTEEIARESEALLNKTNPEWRVVGLNDEFLELVLHLVRAQGLKLSISLNPNDAVVYATAKVKELGAAIMEKGWNEDLLDRAEQKA